MAGMLRIGSVGSLHRYPVKSMMGEELSAARIGARGLQGDRVFALADTETGKIASAKNPSKWPTLFRFQAAFTQPLVDAGPLPPVRITFPDGSTVLTGNGGIDAQLSSSLGKPVRFLSAAPHAGTLEEYWPDIEGRAQRDVVTEEAMPPETVFDLGVIDFITSGTLESLHALYPEGRFESRRFRPNLVIEAAPRGNGVPGREWTV